jgi:acyl-CoA thioester hydrolase
MKTAEGSNENPVKHQIRVKIYYEDTDAGGVVYYANYLRYMERARTEFLSEKGMSIAEHHRQGFFFVVVHVDISYKQPARLGDIISITSEITEMKNVSIVFKNQVFKETQMLAEARVTLACIDKNGRPQRIPEDVRVLMEKTARGNVL